MTHEREQSHAAQATSSTTSDHDLPKPARASRSALLRKPAVALPSGLLSRQARDANGVAANAEAAVANAASSTGSPLPSGLMRKFEASLGADLSAVRVHTGEASATANDAVGAKAYTVGNDIHFGAGHYDPSSPAGEQLLAHEVAHTVQQGSGAQRMQFKLDVSSPGDAHELEADRAAEAMVVGNAASVSFGAGVQRKVMREAGPVKEGKKPTMTLAEFPVAVLKTELGPFELTGKATLAVKLSPEAPGPEAGKGGKEGEKQGGKEEGKEGGKEGSGVEVDSEVSKNGVEVKAAKEFGPETWSTKPKLVGTAGLDKEGKPSISYGIELEHEGHKFKNGQLGPFSVQFKTFEWKAGSEPEILALELKTAASLTSGTSFLGYYPSVEVSLEADVQPNWAEIVKWLGEQMAAAVSSGLAGAAAAIAAPMAWLAVGLYGWSKAGHEFDELSSTVDNFHLKVQATAREAMTGVHVPLKLLGKDLAADISPTAKQVRAAICKELKVPEGALAEIAKQHPGVATKIYQLAWSKMWPGVKAHLLALYADTTFHDYGQERNFIEGYDKGSYSES